MALKARSPIVAMATNPLSQAQTARLLAAECYRLMSAHNLLCDEHRILSKLADVEADWRMSKLADEQADFKFATARFYELNRIVRESIHKMSDALRQVHELGEEKLGALPQASLSVFGTITCGERRSITQALEPQDFKDGAVLIKEGDPRDAFFIIVQGQVTCMQRRDHRAKSAPPHAAPLECLSAPGPQRPGTPGPRCSARQGCASRRENRSATKGPWRLAASSAANRATQAPISRTHPTGPAWTRPCSSETAC